MFRSHALVIAVGATLFALPVHAERSRDDYRYFRALTIDLAGRIPTRDELAAFEKPDFDFDKYIDARTTGPAYAERIRRIYLDLLRLEVNPGFFFAFSSTTLMREKIVGPTGAPEYIYYRYPQLRARPETNYSFCLTKTESGLEFNPDLPATGAAIPVSQAALDAATVLVKPWWLTAKAGAFAPIPELLTDADGTTKTALVRVCREEAQALPCESGTTFSTSAQCGCGPSLERCIPGAGPYRDSAAFSLPRRAMFSAEAPTERLADAGSSWSRFWWSQEAVRLIDHVVANNIDFREIITAKYSFINGPLAQFHRSLAGSSCCGEGLKFDYNIPELLFEPGRVPADLHPTATGEWRRIEDRGPRAAGLLTMPVFLAKYATRRGRAHALYNTFLCRDFVAGDVKLTPSTEPDLTKREGCSTCHSTLEPMAAYFARVAESSWNWLPAAKFPLESTQCAGFDPITRPECAAFYDPAFTSKTSAKLFGTYAAPDRAEKGPRGLALELADHPEFGSCVVRNVAASLLGRSLAEGDATLLSDLTSMFASDGYRLRSFVKALLRSEAYRRTNRLGGGS